jgi:dipeptidyl aminopeptidase/acylaminoacyl peptidase
MYKKLLFLLFLGVSSVAFAQNSSQLTVEKIMRDPKWIGTAPEGVFWDLEGKHIYFNWNPEGADLPSLYRTSTNGQPEKVSIESQKGLIRQYQYDSKKQQIVFTKNGDIYLKNVKTGAEKRITHTSANESNPRFAAGDQKIIFQQGDNFFSVSLQENEWVQLTNFARGGGNSAAAGAGMGAGARGGMGAGALSIAGGNAQGGAQGGAQGPRNQHPQNPWLRTDQLALFDVLKENKHMDSVRRVQRNELAVAPELRTINITEGMLTGQSISPDLRYVYYRVMLPATGNTNTIVPNYVTESGYTEDIPARTKVGNVLSTSKSYLFDREKNAIIPIKTSDIPGIKDLPDFWNDYPKEKEALLKKNEDRNVTVSAPNWNASGTAAFVTITASDNKDRWIMRLNPSDGSLSLIDRQRDEAWIGGPGISGFGGGNIGWIDEQTIYFQSEASGYSHVYTANIQTGDKKQLTSGKWEVQTLQLSADNKHFYLKGNKEHPGITHFYKLPVQGGELVQITSMKGGNEVTMSPDEKWLAIRYSYSTKPWELYIQENKPGAKAKQITESVTEEFKSYAWKDPEVISFKNRHGDDVYARVYQPKTAKKGNPAVIFVHGAGYLQNVHYWWSQYFREYMFHNLLVDLGYTVLDIDFTASSGYGRDHRTGIYRHMGGKDLSDQVDGAKLLVEKYGVNPKNIGLYGGSYGGFITLMALFNEPEVFAAGAALRSVTDWAHYNHGYTSNILNEPFTDPIAYRQSSPIYFADGLKGHLLMAHGMVDVNVHFQDIVRLSQRLIELGKDNWELAVYPVEDHGFVTPSSWTDEYKRILKLFEERLTNE